MNISFIKQNDSRHLILLMAGWGMDPTPFAALDYPGYDIAVTWDYTDETFDTSSLVCYREIIVLAWSMGVMEANRIIPRLCLPVTLSVAINGTPTPVENNAGIPEEIFNGTLNTLSDTTLYRFNRRMCGSAEAFTHFNKKAPARTIGSLREELRILGKRAHDVTAGQSMHWDLAVIGSRDMIFPTANQLYAWTHTPTIQINRPHLPDFQAIINRLVVNKRRVASRFGESRETYDSKATSQHSVAESLARNLIQFSSRRTTPYEYAIEIGAGVGRLTAIYANTLKISRLELWDLTMPSVCSGNENIIGIADDAEARLFELNDNSIDLVVSASTIQWFNSPCSAIRQIERILKPGGMAAITLYTTGTYGSLAQATGVSINYVSPDRIRQSLSDGCDILYFNTDHHTEKFSNTRQLIDHMRLTGVNAAGTASTATLRRLLIDSTLNRLEYNSTSIIFQKR